MASSSAWRWSSVFGVGLDADSALTLTAPAHKMLATATTTAATRTVGRMDLRVVVFVMPAADRVRLNGRGMAPLTCGFRSLSSL